MPADLLVCQADKTRWQRGAGGAEFYNTVRKCPQISEKHILRLMLTLLTYKEIDFFFHFNNFETINLFKFIKESFHSVAII